jgi:hypothetical protein
MATPHRSRFAGDVGAADCAGSCRPRVPRRDCRTPIPVCTGKLGGRGSADGSADGVPYGGAIRAGPPHPVRRAKVTDVLLKAPAIFSRIDDCPCPWRGMEWSMRASCTVGFVGHLASGMREAHFAYRISAIAIVEQSDKSDNSAKRLRPERNHG